MQRLQAGILRNDMGFCLSCGTPGGTCWCSGTPRNPRHEEGALAGLLRPRGRTFA